MEKKKRKDFPLPLLPLPWPYKNRLCVQRAGRMDSQGTPSEVLSNLTPNA